VVLNRLKKIQVRRETQDYINRYQVIYKSVIREAKQTESGRYVLRVNYKTKEMWQIISKEVGKSLQYDQKTELINRTEIIPNLQNLTDTLNSLL
jgi:hypothetical protein